MFNEAHDAVLVRRPDTKTNFETFGHIRPGQEGGIFFLHIPRSFISTST